MNNLKNRLIEFLRTQHREYGSMQLAEQAVPSYLHKYRTVRYIFWRRLELVVRRAQKDRKVGDWIDFGSGTGVLLPFLNEGSPQRIFAVESAPHARAILENTLGTFSLGNAKVVTSLDDLSELSASSIDTVTALDVFEHIDDLDDLLIELHRLMKPGARLIVSSPTETWFYKFARRFGGPEYTGHYHVSDARQVEAQLAKLFKVKLAARIFPGLTFFRIVECYKIV